MRSQFSLLAKRRFLPLFITQLVSAFSDNLFKTSLSMLITYGLKDQENPELLIMIGAVLFMLPFVLFSGPAGQIADKYEKSRLIKFLKIAELVLAMFSVVALFNGNIYFMMAILFLFGTQSTFFGPMKYSILPMHLKQDELVAGNGLIESSTFFAILLGSVIAGIIPLDFQGKIIISGLMVGVSLIGLIASNFIPVAQEADPDLKLDFSFKSLMHETSEIAVANKEAFLAILGISWFWMIGSAMITELPAYAKNSLQCNEGVATLLFSSFSIGIMIGSILCNRLMKGEINANYIPIAAFGMSIFTYDLSLVSVDNGGHLLNIAEFFTTPIYWRVWFDLFALALCGGLYIVPLYVMLQVKSNSIFCSRIIAANNFFNTLFIFIYSGILATLISHGYTVNRIFALTATLNTVMVLYMCKLLPEVTLKYLLKQTLKLLYRVEVRGLEHFKSVDSKAIIIINHASFLDPLLAAAFLPGRITFVINTYIAKKVWVRPFLTLIKTFALDPSNPLTLKDCIKEVEGGAKCVVFPEGRITVTGSLMKIYEGPAMIAHKAGAPIIPIQIEGAQYTPFSNLKGKLRIKLFPKITINIMPPKTIEAPESLGSKERRAYLANKLYDIMSNMGFESTKRSKTIFKALLDAKSLNGRHHLIAEDMDRDPISYDELISRSFAIGHAISNFTDRYEAVGIYMPNSVDAIVTFFALQGYSRVASFLDYGSDVANLIANCKTAKIKNLIVSRSFIEKSKFEVVVDELRLGGVNVVYFETLVHKLSLLDCALAGLATIAPYTLYNLLNNRTTPHADSAAIILFKEDNNAIVLSHRNINTHRYQFSSRIDFGPSDKVFNVISLSDCFSLAAGTLLPILSGVKVFFYPVPSHYHVIPEMVYDTDSTVVFGNELLFQNCLDLAHPYDFYSVRYAFSNSGKLPNKLYRAWLDKFGIRIFESFGLAETTSMISVNTPMHNKYGSLGRIMPGIEYKTEKNHLYIKSDNVMFGSISKSKPGVIKNNQNEYLELANNIIIDADGYLVTK